MGNVKSMYKRQFSEEDSDSNYYADKEMDDERRPERNSSSKRVKVPKKRKSRSRSRSTRQDKIHSRAWSKSPKRDDYRSNTKYDTRRYKYTSSYYCKDCNVYLNAYPSWLQHSAGKRHASNIDGEKRAEPRRESFRRMISVERENYQRENNMNRKRKLVEELRHEKKKYVGLDYVLVIHKQGKSVFQCFLCDTRTVYHNSKQLADHVLGDKHQKAYVEQHDKGLIKIKRLKSKNPGKGMLEEVIDQKIFNPNRTETNAKPIFETSTVRKCKDSLSNSDKKRSFSRSQRNRSSTSAAKNVPRYNFLKKTLDQVNFYNRKYTLKMMSTTYVPKRFSSTSPQNGSSKVPTVEGDSTPPICAPSPKSPASQNGTITLSDDDDTYGPFPSSSTYGPFPSSSTYGPFPNSSTYGPFPSTSTCGPIPSSSTCGPIPSSSTCGPIPSSSTCGPVPSSSHSTKAVIPDIYELAGKLTPIDVFNLVLMKLKNVELSKEDIPLLNKVADETAVLSKKFKEECLNSMLHVEKDINVEENYIPFLNEVVEDNAIRTEEILIDTESEGELIMENSALPTNVDQDTAIILSHSFWNMLPSSRELDNILSSFPDLLDKANGDEK